MLDIETISVKSKPWLQTAAELINLLQRQVGERVGLRDAVLLHIAEKMLAPLALLVIGSGFLLWISLEDGLLQLRQLSHVLSRRSPRERQPAS